MKAFSITPPPEPPDGSATPPGSKSHTIRALFAAAAADGISTLVAPLDSEDTRHARACLRQLGVVIEEDDKAWKVTGTGGRFESPRNPLDAGESGLTARFLMGMAPFVPGEFEIRGRGRLPDRPMGAILANLERRGAIVGKGHPWTIDATNADRSGAFSIDGSVSTQMVSALLMAAPLPGGRTKIAVENPAVSAEYVEVTLDVVRAFGAMVEEVDSGFEVEPGGYKATIYKVPVDASSAVYPACAAAMTGGRIEVLGDPGMHPDRVIFDILAQMGCDVEVTAKGRVVSGPDRLDAVALDMSGAPDAAVAVAVACAVASGPSRIEGLASLRHKESDRLAALETELVKLGAVVETDRDSIRIVPVVPAGARFATHNDHRIAMSLALLGLVTWGVVIEDPHVVDKTWPGFWKWLESTGAGITSI